MKKIFVLIFVLMFAVVLSACNGADSNPTCDKGEELVAGECVAPTTCETDEKLVDDTCVKIADTCVSPEEYIDNECKVPDPVCVLPEVLISGECNVPDPVCEDNEELIDGECELIVTDAELAFGAIDGLNFDLFIVTEDLILPTISASGHTIVWNSSNEGVIGHDGSVNRPSFEEGDATVTLVATVTINDAVATVDFLFTVTKLEQVITDDVDIITDRDAIDLGDLTSVSSKLSLPKSGSLGSSIVWTCSDERIISTKGYVNRPSFLEGDVNVTLTATLTLGDYTETRDFEVTVLKEDENFVSSIVNLPFENLAEEYIVPEGFIDIYYMNDNQLPYVDIQEFINLLSGAIVSSEISVIGNGDLLEVSYVLAGDVGEEDYTMLMTYDFTNNTMTVNDFGFFDSLSESTQTDFGNGLEVIDYVYTDPSAVSVDFDDYDFDIVYEDGKYLIPFHFANLYYSGGMFDAYYNGDKVYGVDTYQLMDSDAIAPTVIESSFNGKTMDESVREATYDFLAYTFDYFYGLKDFRNVDTYYSELDSYYTKMVTRSDKNAYSAIFDFIYDTDDLHTSHITPGYYESFYELSLAWEDLGPNTEAYYNAYYDIDGVCGTRQGYRILDDGKIAVIFIGGFEAETPEEVGTMLTEIQALGTVESIVIDLACNGGGNLGATIQIIGYMTDEPIPVSQVSTTDGASVTWYYTTANAAVDVDWYILSSPVTFSAANLMTSIAKDMGIATIIGQDSSGGACSITAILLPDGSAVLLSSTGMLTDTAYNSIEKGIRVNIAMSDVTSDSEIVSIINGQ